VPTVRINSVESSLIAARRSPGGGSESLLDAILSRLAKRPASTSRQPRELLVQLIATSRCLLRGVSASRYAGRIGLLECVHLLCVGRRRLLLSLGLGLFLLLLCGLLAPALLGTTSHGPGSGADRSAFPCVTRDGSNHCASGSTLCRSRHPGTIGRVVHFVRRCCRSRSRTSGVNSGLGSSPCVAFGLIFLLLVRFLPFCWINKNSKLLMGPFGIGG
jgi:hypothetical protein